jgi:glycosyltransferase involved in cell wall biosynthesis
MKVTVAICTWNRAELLDQTLAQLRHLRAPAGVAWELLVVNNNCGDHTDAVIARHQPHLPLRRLFEPKQGLSNARNCAIDHAGGELLLWTDDDVLVERDWLTAYVEAAARFPKAGFFGGTVDPWFAVAPPAWVLRNLRRFEGPFAVRQLGPDVRPLAAGEEVFGANMAFRTALLSALRFDPTLGRIGAGMLSGEETSVTGQLRRAGRYGVWIGTARVRHYIPADRLTVAYLWRYMVGGARTQQRMDQAPADDPVGPVRRYRWARRHYWLACAKERLLAGYKGDRWVTSLQRAAWLRGMMEESRAAAGGEA